MTPRHLGLRRLSPHSSRTRDTVHPRRSTGDATLSGTVLQEREGGQIVVGRGLPTEGKRKEVFRLRVGVSPSGGREMWGSGGAGYSPTRRRELPWIFRVLFSYSTVGTRPPDLGPWVYDPVYPVDTPDMTPELGRKIHPTPP